MTEITFLLAAVLLAASLYIIYIQFVQKKHSQTHYSSQEIEEEKAKLQEEYRQKTAQKVADLRTEFAERNEIQIEKLKLQAQSNIQKEEEQMRQRVLDLQIKMEAKEEKMEIEKDRIEQIKEELRKIKTDLLSKRDEILAKEKQLGVEYEEKISKIAQLTKVEAQKSILETAKLEMGGELLQWQQKFLESTEDDANQKAREIVALAVQRCSSEVANEFTITTVQLKDDNDKGKLIGKQGRNIQWLEKTLGVELVIDDTPEIITISG